MTEEVLKSMDRRISMLETEVARLKDTKSSSKASDDGLLPFSMLENEWANKEIRKDPNFWIKDGGTSFVGRKYSAAPAKYLDQLADFRTYCATQEQKKPVEEQKKNAKGKFYWEGDLFEAKILRTWAAKKRASNDEELPGLEDDGSIPF